jgi:dTDP-4-dehydrorhamnose 3,5-epimerase
MIFTETALAGAWIIDLERREDSRGFFARMFCQHEFADHGLEPIIAQANIARSDRRGTLRGMHFQYPPAAETKYVTCPRGAILDVIVDLRPESPTYLRHISVELTEDNHRGIYIPQRFAHGYQTLADDTVTTYMVGEFYTPGSEGGLAYDDPDLGIAWPLEVTAISDKDAAWPHLVEVGPDVAGRMRTEAGA